MKIKYIEWYGKSGLWSISGIEIRLSSIFTKKYGDELIKESISTIEENIRGRKPVTELVEKVGLVSVFRLLLNFFSADIKEYFYHHAKSFTENREEIGMEKFFEKVFGKHVRQRLSNTEFKELKSIITEIVYSEYNLQCEMFPQDNIKELLSDKDIWSIYSMNGPTLNLQNIDYGKISNIGIRQEVKSYFREILMGRKNLGISINSEYAPMVRGFNFITNFNPNVKSCADITETDVRALINHLQNDAVSFYNDTLKPESIRKVIQKCGYVVKFLIKHYDQPNSRHLIPKHNFFSKVTFHNNHRMLEKTLPIPQVVLEQINEKIDELNPYYQSIFKVFINTGLRAKEVSLLEEKCLAFNDEEQVWALTYIPYKVLSQRRKRGQSDYHCIVVDNATANIINEQIVRTAKLREKYNSPYIFINENLGSKVTLINLKEFKTTINNLIKKYNIIDMSGEIWKYTNRQCRKTVAVNMIENGATTSEVANQLAHNSERTTERYYAEVRELRLVELNTDFFKKKFEVMVGEKQLSQYTEEERKALYIDFRLRYREVEFGYCTKHISSGLCGQRTGTSNCAICPNLCTGYKYLEKWTSLRDSQKSIVKELLDIYEREGITDYRNYREYQRETYLLDSYESVVEKIMANERMD